MSAPVPPNEIEIDPRETRQRLAAGAVLVDVREADELEQAAYDVPGLIHLPLSEIADRFDELPRDKDIVMACRSGGRSMRATTFLHGQGFDRVVNMSGGILRWQEKGYPMKGQLPGQPVGTDPDPS